MDQEEFPDILKAVSEATSNLLPTKSKEKYEKCYELFCQWRIIKKVQGINEDILIAYFFEKMDNRVATYSSEIENSEIDSLQEDIGSLIQNINQFITTQPKQEETCHTDSYEYTNDGNTSEKDDGIPEKCTGKEIELTAPAEHDIADATSDSESEVDSETEIDWSVAGPVLQKHISDLERLHSLNLATSSLIRRLKKLTVQKSMQLLND